MKQNPSGQMKTSSYILCTIIFVAIIGPCTFAIGGEFHVTFSESEGAVGLERALRLAREHRAIFPNDAIIIDLPRYISISKTITLDVRDSGEPDAPLVIRGLADKGSTISGGKNLESETLPHSNSRSDPQSPPSVWNRMRRARLGGLASVLSPTISPRAYFVDRAPGRMFVFEGERRLVPSRFPEDGFATNLTAIQSGGANSISFELPREAPDLAGQNELWIAGYWGWNWWFEQLKVLSVDNNRIIFQAPSSPVRNTSRYFIVGINKLDRGGFYYFNQNEKAIYYLMTNDDAISALNVPIVDTLLKITEAHDVHLESIAFEKTIGPAIIMENARNVVLKDCFVGHTGSHGVVITGGKSNRVENCVLDDLGLSGIVIDGGDRKTLALGDHIVQSTRISGFGREVPAYRPGIRLMGVGNAIYGCEITGGPHSGIIFEGNDHRIVGNILHDLVLNTSDAGAIYSGRDWTYRGTLIKSNYIYNVNDRVDGSVAIGVYLDDQLSGSEVSGNVFLNVDRPILLGGGRDNLVSENLFMNTKGAGPVWVDARGLKWQAVMGMPDGLLTKGLAQVPFKEWPYTAHYPELAKILEDHPGAPLNNRIVRNLGQSVPIVMYDSPETASFGFDSGNERIDPVEINFPASLDGLPLTSPALPRLKETQTLIQQTLKNVKQLRFLQKVDDE